MHARGKILRYVIIAGQRSAVPVAAGTAVIESGGSGGCAQGMHARAGTVGGARSTGSTLPGGISYGAGATGFGRFAGGVWLASTRARSAGNVAQQPAGRRTEDCVHEKPAGGL